MTDKLFWHGLHRTIYGRINSKTTAKTYVYRFSVDSETYNHYRIYFCDKNVRGTAHADDLSYIFKNLFSDVPPKESFEYRVMTEMVGSSWSLFATTILTKSFQIGLFSQFASNDGNPNGKVTDIWEPIGEDFGAYKCLNIANDGLEFIDFPEMERMKLWDSMYEKEQLY